jgi:diguanylate cyclase
VLVADESGATRAALTSWRLLVAIMCVVVAMIAIGVWALQSQIRTRTLDSTAKGVMILSSVVIDRSLTLNDIDDGIHPTNRSKLDGDLILLKERGHVISLAIWALSDGGLVYADVDNTVEGTLSLEMVDRARAGTPFAGPGAHRSGEALEIYYPYDANGDQIMDAVAQVVLPRQELDQSIANSTRLLYAGGAVVLLIVITGILQVRRRQLAQDHATVHDALTGLGNRILLRRLAAPMLNASSPRSPTGLLLIDLDGFKGVNDSLGHNAGDDLLVTVARRLTEVCGPASATAIRLGGDEFAVLIPRLAEPAAALGVAERIRDAIRAPMTISGCGVEIDASIGVAWAPTHGVEPGALLHCADVAMYRAKATGAGVVAYESTLNHSSDRDATVLPELREALAGDELRLDYRPRRGPDAAPGEVTAVPRWDHPRRGPLSAEEFLPAVERTSLLAPLMGWILGTAARDCAEWRRAGNPARVAVSLPARVAADENLPDLLRRVCADAGLPVSALRLEITEATLLADPDRAGATLRRLAATGAAVTVTEVGAVYAALADVSSTDIASLAVAGDFADRVLDSRLAAAAVAGLTRLGHQLGVTVSARARTADLAERLRDLGCDDVEGPEPFARPGPRRDQESVTTMGGLR